VLFVPSHTLPIIHPKNSIVTIHDVAFERDRNIYQRREIGAEMPFRRRLLNAMARIFTMGRYGANTLDYLAWSTIYGLKHAKKVITVSEFSLKEIKSVYQRILPDKKFNQIRVVHNGFDDHLFCENVVPEQANQVLSKYGITKPYLFYLGRIERKKNIPNLIESFGLLQKTVPDINLVLTGASSFGSDEVDYMISEYGLDRKVIKTGWVDEADLPSIFSQATAFVFPSLHEGFGIPLLEAMACGIPIAASTAEAIVEVCGNAASYFDPRDIKSMADGISRVITDQALRDDLIERGRIRSANFSWQRCAKETLTVLLER
jgi:glycosyltransferase involved in cell wall biosynthesis